MKWPTSNMLQDLSYFLNVIKKLLCTYYLVFQKYGTFWRVSIRHFILSSINLCFLRNVLCTYVLTWYEWKGICNIFSLMKIFVPIFFSLFHSNSCSRSITQNFCRHALNVARLWLVHFFQAGISPTWLPL